MKINNFDLIRLFAASQVLILHATSHLNIAKPFFGSLLGAFPGVPIFFVISGFLISASYERSSSLKNYAINRLLRIYPGLWCCILVTIMVAFYFGVDFLNYQSLPWVVSQFIGVIYTPKFLNDFGFGSYNGSLWTIPLELQFYIALPFFYWMFRKKTTIYFWIAWLIFISIAIILRIKFPSMGSLEIESKLEKLIRYTFVPYFYLFLTGVLLQKMEAYKSNLITNKGIYWLCGYIAFHYLAPPSVATYFISNIVLAIVTISMAYSMTWISHSLLKGNDISYGVYIYHGLLINVFIEMGVNGKAEYLLLLITLTYILAYMSWIIIEKPFMRRKQRTINPELQTS